MSKSRARFTFYAMDSSLLLRIDCTRPNITITVSNHERSKRVKTRAHVRIVLRNRNFVLSHFISIIIAQIERRGVVCSTLKRLAHTKPGKPAVRQRARAAALRSPAFVIRLHSTIHQVLASLVLRSSLRLSTPHDLRQSRSLCDCSVVHLASDPSWSEPASHLSR